MAITPPRDRVKCLTASNGGTGISITLGAAAANLFLTPSEAGMVNGETYEYVVEQGNDWEHNEGSFTASTNVITRGTPIRSRVGGSFGTSKVNMGATATVYFPHTERTLFSAGPGGCCQLIGGSATTLELVPFGGRLLWINRRPQLVPVSGVVVNNIGLSAHTLYYVYAYMSDVNTMALECSTTYPVWDSLTGLPVKNGDVTRTFVGAVITNANGSFSFSDTDYQSSVNGPAWSTLRSWFNDYGFCARYIAAGTTSGIVKNGPVNYSSPSEFHTAMRAPYIAWEGESIYHAFTAQLWQYASNDGLYRGFIAMALFAGPGYVNNFSGGWIVPGTYAAGNHCGQNWSTANGAGALAGLGDARFYGGGFNFAAAMVSNLFITNVNAGDAWWFPAADYWNESVAQHIVAPTKFSGSGYDF